MGHKYNSFKDNVSSREILTLNFKNIVKSDLGIYFRSKRFAFFFLNFLLLESFKTRHKLKCSKKV